MPAKILSQPLFDSSAVEADFAAPGGPNADEHPRER
jgi:hypothetical protein